MGLVGLVQHHSVPHIPLRVSEVLLLLHRPDNIELWDTKDPMNAFWDISGQVGSARSKVNCGSGFIQLRD